MKKEYVRSTLSGGERKKVEAQAKAGDPLVGYLDLVRALADIADEAVGGMDCWANFGLSKDKSCIMLTVTYGGSKLYASGATLEEVSKAAGELL